MSWFKRFRNRKKKVRFTPLEQDQDADADGTEVVQGIIIDDPPPYSEVAPGMVYATPVYPPFHQSPLATAPPSTAPASYGSGHGSGYTNAFPQYPPVAPPPVKPVSKSKPKDETVQELYPSGRVKFVGTVVKGSPNGVTRTGVLFYDSGSSPIRYTGEFKDRFFHGKGDERAVDGMLYRTGKWAVGRFMEGTRYLFDLEKNLLRIQTIRKGRVVDEIVIEDPSGTAEMAELYKID